MGGLLTCLDLLCVTTSKYHYIKLNSGQQMATEKRIETRGRPSLSDEPSVRAAVILPESIYNKLVSLGDKSGKGYGHFIREAVMEKHGRKKRSANKKGK